MTFYDTAKTYFDGKFLADTNFSNTVPQPANTYPIPTIGNWQLRNSGSFDNFILLDELIGNAQPAAMGQLYLVTRNIQIHVYAASEATKNAYNAAIVSYIKQYILVGAMWIWENDMPLPKGTDNYSEEFISLSQQMFE